MSYEKYVFCSFSYFSAEQDHLLLLYTGKVSNFMGDSNCERCGKYLKGKTAHVFTEEGTGDFDGVEIVFGSECVKYVFGAGIK